MFIEDVGDVMSSPIDRSSDLEGVSDYAPKWMRDLHSASRQHAAEPSLHLIRGAQIVSIVPAEGPATERSQSPDLPAPSTMPEPSRPDPWLRSNARALLRGVVSIRAFLPIFFTIFLATLIASVVALELPKLWSPGGAPRPVADSFGERFGADAPGSPAAPWITASELPRGSATRASAPSGADPWVAGVNPAVAPVTRPSPVAPSSPAVATRGPENLAPAIPAPANPAPAAVAPTPPATAVLTPSSPMPTMSARANPAPIAVAPPAANMAPSAPLVPVTRVKTISVQPEKPARPLDPDQIETLLKQGDDFVANGDFAGARVIFRRVAEAHDARGALAFAATYDPIMLAKIRAKGATPDVAKAREWYGMARDLGSPDAVARLEVLAKSTQ